MLPLLQFASDNDEHSVRDAIECLSSQFELSEEDRKELLPSGLQFTFDSRVNWARTYLQKAKLLSSTRRSHFQITERGLEILKEPPPRLTNKYLQQFPEFAVFKTKRNAQGNDSPDINECPDSLIDEEEEKSPEETIEIAYEQIRRELCADLIQQIMKCSPTFFDRMLIDLLVKMGYGGTRQEAGQAVSRNNEGGIEGLIKEDRLGLNTIYLQAKRWGGVVGRPEIQKFVGALHGHRAKRGIFITTSKFTHEAEEYAAGLETKVVLLDGELLADLMIDYNIGVAPDRSYEIKRIDSDYFADS